MKTNEQLELMIKELSNEIKETNKVNNELCDELFKVKEKIRSLEEQLGDNAIVIKKKRKYTDKEIYEIRMKSSLHKSAAYLGISVSSVQRACNRYLSECDNTEE